jgi:hypothetical protein
MVTRSSGISALVAGAILLAGCASTGPAAPDPAADESKLGVIYVYHLSDSGFAKGMGVLAMRRALITVDDKEPFTLSPGVHARLAVEPGFHTLYAKTSIYGMPGLPIGTQKVEVKAGETHYLHYFEHGEGGFIVQRFVAEDEATGSKGVASTKSTAEK